MKAEAKVLSSIAARSAILLGAIFIVFQACNVSTASLSDVTICPALKTDGSCGSSSAQFHSTDPVIYCSAVLKNAPSGTKVSFSWKHEDKDLGTANVETGSAYVNSSYTSPGVIEPGNYSVTVKINTDNSQPVTKTFTVVE